MLFEPGEACKATLHDYTKAGVSLLIGYRQLERFSGPDILAAQQKAARNTAHELRERFKSRTKAALDSLPAGWYSTGT